MIHLIHHGIVLFLVVVFPIWDYFETRLLKTRRHPSIRLHSYFKTMAWQIAFVALIVATMPGSEWITPPPLHIENSHGIVTVPRFHPVIIALIVVGFTSLILPFALSRFIPELKEEEQKRYNEIAFFLPQTPLERRWFVVLSLAVGVCEEIIFRGFLIRYFMAAPFHFSVVPAVLASAFVFGIDHGYQGWQGMLTTTFFALVLTAIYFAAGNLWVPMLFHVLMDLRLLLIMPQAPAHRTQ